MDTLDEIKEIIKQLGLAQAASAKRHAEWEKRQAKSEAELRKWREEAKQRQAEWEKRLAESEKGQAESKKRLDEVGKYLEYVGRKIDSIGQQLASIGFNNGAFAEELFFTSFLEYPVLGGVRYDIVERNVRDRLGLTEYDILMHNSHASAIIEVKYRARIEDIQELLEKKPKAFRKSYSEYSGHDLYLGLASTVTYDELIIAAREAGIYLLGQKGYRMEVMNEEVRCF